MRPGDAARRIGDELGRLASRRPRRAGRTGFGLGAETVITLRLADRARDSAVERLVQLSGHERPSGPSLVAEVNGEPRAALSLAGGPLLGDPFHPTAELGSLLTLRLAQLEARSDAPSLRSA